MNDWYIKPLLTEKTKPTYLECPDGTCNYECAKNHAKDKGNMTRTLARAKLRLVNDKDEPIIGR